MHKRSRLFGDGLISTPYCSYGGALGEDAAAFNCPLLGGDSVSTPGPLMISITAFGRVPPDQMVRRTGAKSGDLVAVTGTIGDAALGLRMLKGEGEGFDTLSREFLIQRYRVPQPRNALALAIRDHASASMDVSDGLAGDLTKLCAASGVSATVSLADVPLSAPVRAFIAKGRSDIEAAISGGDDYEVLCTVPENRWDSFTAAAQQAGVRPICGAEVSVDGYPLLLLCENAAGYRNLCRLITREKMRPRATGTDAAPLTVGELAAYASGLIALSGGAEGRLAAALDQRAGARATAAPAPAAPTAGARP